MLHLYKRPGNYLLFVVQVTLPCDVLIAPPNQWLQAAPCHWFDESPHTSHSEYLLRNPGETSECRDNPDPEETLEEISVFFKGT